MDLPSFTETPRGSYRAVVVGHTGRGNYGHGIDTAFGLVPGVSIVALADPDEAGRQAASAKLGVRTTYADYQEMLAKERPDLVAVCPRHVDQHEALVTAAAESGARGIYCEKPFARTPAEGDRMLAACERRGVKVVVAHRGRENPYLQWVKRQLEEEIGPLRVLRGHGKGDRRAGAQDTAVLGTHVFDQMRYLAGDVVSVSGLVTKGGRPIAAGAVEDGPEGLGPIAGDALHATYLFANGVVGHFDSYQVDRPGERWFGLDVYGERGSVTVRDLPRGDVFRYASGTWVPDESAGRWERVSLPEWDRAPDGSERTQQQKMAESNRRNALALVLAVEHDRAPDGVSTGRDGVAALEMVLAPAESQRTGSHVAIPLRQRENPYELIRQGVTR
jgi:predicted dehydrogenase